MLETLIFLALVVIIFVSVFFNLSLNADIVKLIGEKEELIEDNKFLNKRNHKLAYEKQVLKKLIESQEVLITDFQNQLN